MSPSTVFTLTRETFVADPGSAVDQLFHAPALRFGEPRRQALAGALCTTMLAVTAITNKSLRAMMTRLLDGTAYGMNLPPRG